MTSKMTKPNIGSDWKKWDLHIHTPNTKLSDSFESAGGIDLWDKFCESVENSDVEVFGVTDYFSVENYFTFLDKFKVKYPLSRKIFFSNIELRLEVSVNKKAEEVNLHVIFSPNTKKAKITSFLSKQNTNISRNGASVSCKDLLTRTDYESAGVDYKILRETLKEVFGEDDCYLIFAASNNAGLRPDNNSPRKLNITDEIDKICDGFFGGQQNTEYYLNTNRYKDDGVAKKKPVVGGCDAHSFDDLDNWLGKRFVKTVEKTEVIEKDITWVKAEPTFEGLKQIVYEPETRVFIGEEKPKNPINAINSITLGIPSDSKVGKDNFCFAGNESTYNLNPYFNCFIGGRGSGKSTILNFLGLHSNNPDSSKLFWLGDSKDKKGLSPVGFDPNSSDIFSFEGTEIFEFLAQSEIETFARDKIKFTQAIYNRANSLAGSILEEYEETIELLKGKLGQIIQTVSNLQILKGQKIAKEKEKRTLESSVKVLSSKKYTEIITGITEKSKELQKLEEWKGNISDLKKSLTELILESESEESEEKAGKTEYEKSYVLAITKIGEAAELLKEEKFTEEATKEAEIKKALIDLENKAKILIEKVGYASESVEQIKSAPQKITNLESEIKNLVSQIEAKTKIIATLDSVVSELNTDKQNYENKITEILKPLQSILKKQFESNHGKDIKQISLEYSFDEKSAWVTLANEFYNQFRVEYGDSERSKEVCDFVNDNMQTFAENSFDDIKKLVRQSQKGDKKYTKFLDEVFKDENNFKVFQAIRDKHLYDVKTNKVIQVKYDNKDVEQASFGQRCTAVVVILLLFGNYPLIIDEPETHLDSSLIANYLVPLLKEKKSDRQIIFATHNANFVINGDAEKIFILKNDSGQTEVIETTIEDIKNREELLKLEGGKEAFEKRGEKLNIM